MTHKRVALVLLGGSLLLLTPFLVSLSQGVEKSIFSAMATLTDVKETLDEKLILMSDLYLSLDTAPEAERFTKAKEAQKHYKYAEDVYKLSSSFIAASSKRYPRYSTFWERYKKRLGTTWTEISSVHDKINQQVAQMKAKGVKPIQVAKAVPKASTNTAANVKAMAKAQQDRAAQVAAQRAQAQRAAAQRNAAAKKAAAQRAAAAKAQAAKVAKAKAEAERLAAARKAQAQLRAQAQKATQPRAKVTVGKKKLARKDVLERYREGYQYFAQGGANNLDKAASAFREILDTQPAFHLARYWLAKTYLLQNNLKEARKESGSLLAAQPNLQIAKDLAREVDTIVGLKAKGQLPRRAAPVKVTQVKRPAPVVAKAPVKKAPVPAKNSLIEQATAAMLARVNRRVDRNTGTTPKRYPRPKPRAIKAPSVPKAPVIAKAPVRRYRPESSGTKAQSKGNHRPIACMVENSKRARPQAGLSLADIVFEMPVEGGITRFMAVFLDPENAKVEKIGPVRSARHYFVQQVPSFDALYAHCGASTMGYAEIKKAGVDDIDEIKYGYGFFRDNERKAPHNLFTKLGNLRKAFKRRGFQVKSRKRPEFLPVLAKNARSYSPHYVDVDIRYHRKYSVKYTYDPMQDKYFRCINDKPHVEAIDNSQITADNVMIVRVNTRVLDKYGRLDMDLASGGQAELHRGGETIKGTWSRSGRYSDLHFQDERGRNVALNNGRTWVQFINQRGSITLTRRPLARHQAQQLAQIAKADKTRLYAMSDKREASPFGAEPKRRVATVAQQAAVSKAPVTAPVVARPKRTTRTFSSKPVVKKKKPVQVSSLPTSSVRALSSPHKLAPAGPVTIKSVKKPMTQASARDTGVIDVIDFELEAF